MRTAHSAFLRAFGRTVAITLVGVAITAIATEGRAQSSTTTSVVSTKAVGGVAIDPDGLLRDAKTDDMGELSKLRSQSLEKIPGDLNAATEMRKVSLRRLEAALEKCAKNNEPIPDAMKFLGGIQRIQYIFVYPEQNDIVLVGPGEGWKVDPKGNVVGITTGRPVMLLDDLLIALRTARAAANGGITCSIDPTPEGLAQMKQELPSLTAGGDPATVASGIESALGMQRISVTGVPETSHFARVLVAADYRMKRIAMNFDESPVRGLPSYLQMVKPGARGVVSPRFWLEPKYDALWRSADGLAFELRNSSVKAMTEEDFIAAGGDLKHSGKASAAAQNWADLMTEHYSALAIADPIFGELQNCMDLAVIGALIVRESLTDKAGHAMATLMEASDVKPLVFNAPKQVESKASALKKGRHWIISASGGVAINSWILAEQAQASDTLPPVRAKAAPADNAAWCWN